MLSYEEAVEFVRGQLQILTCVLHGDKHELLCEITRRLHDHSPFHNIFLIAEEQEKRQKPNWAEIKAKMLSRSGGLCYTRNTFTFYLLKALGYDVICVVASMLNCLSPPMTHLAIIAKNVKEPGDEYLVDVGLGWPSCEPVDLRFEKESPEFTQYHYTIKYIKENGQIIRIQRTTTQENDKGTRVYSMCPDGLELSKLSEYMDLLYRPVDPNTNRLHQTLICMQFCDEGKVRIICGYFFIRDTHDNNVEEILLKDDEALVNCILENFPQLQKSVVVKAVKNNQMDRRLCAQSDHKL